MSGLINVGKIRPSVEVVNTPLPHLICCSQLRQRQAMQQYTNFSLSIELQFGIHTYMCLPKRSTKSQYGNALSADEAIWVSDVGDSQQSDTDFPMYIFCKILSFHPN